MPPVNVRFSRPELATLQQQYERSGEKTLSAFIRRRCLSDPCSGGRPPRASKG